MHLGCSLHVSVTLGFLFSVDNKKVHTSHGGKCFVNTAHALESSTFSSIPSYTSTFGGAVLEEALKELVLDGDLVGGIVGQDVLMAHIV